jgi:hypothetical protein
VITRRSQPAAHTPKQPDLFAWLRSARRNDEFVAFPVEDLSIRLSRPTDARALRRLADLDSRSRVDSGLHILAERNDVLVAALPLAGGVPIAVPFQPTADIVRVLQLRAQQIRSTARARRPRLGPRAYVPTLRSA